MNDQKERIIKGIKFFRLYSAPDKYDKIVFQKYFPKFLEMIEIYMGVKIEKEDIVETAKTIFNGNEES